MLAEQQLVSLVYLHLIINNQKVVVTVKIDIDDDIHKIIILGTWRLVSLALSGISILICLVVIIVTHFIILVREECDIYYVIVE